MKYIKHYWISKLTGKYLVADNDSINARHPDVEFPGLNVKYWLHDLNGIDICISEVPDETVVSTIIDEVTQKKVIQVLTETEYNSIAQFLDSASELQFQGRFTENEVLMQRSNEQITKAIELLHNT